MNDYSDLLAFAHLDVVSVPAPHTQHWMYCTSTRAGDANTSSAACEGLGLRLIWMRGGGQGNARMIFGGCSTVHNLVRSMVVGSTYLNLVTSLQVQA